MSSDAKAIDIPQPYLLFVGDTTEPGLAKTAYGLRDWAGERCIAEWSAPGCPLSLGLPVLPPAQAFAAGARSLVIGVANSGGFIAQAWIPMLVEALENGLDLVAGLHQRLNDVPVLRETAQRLGRQLIDIRVPPANIPVGTGRKRTGKRLLTVGTDCALGKKYTALALTEAFHGRAIDATFRATGQTGILIAGGGIPMDAVVADFSAGAAELLTPDAAPEHWDIIEGQGSIVHPSFAAVTLGLLHGSQPDVLVVCHERGRSHVLGVEDYPLPDIPELIDLLLALGRLTNPSIRCAGVSLNTSSMTAEEAERWCDQESRRLGMPVADPVRRTTGFAALVDSCLAG